MLDVSKEIFIKIKGSVVCVPVLDLENSLHFYQQVFSLPDLKIEDGMIAVELPSLSIFLMEKSYYESYSLKSGKEAHLPVLTSGLIFSVAVENKSEVDEAIQISSQFGGNSFVASIDEMYESYIGYISDPDGHIWELVFPKPKTISDREG